MVGVAVGVFVTPGRGVCVAVGVALGSTEQVVWLNGKLNFSSGNVPARPAIFRVTAGSLLDQAGIVIFGIISVILTGAVGAAIAAA
jgi:hypothetical protein